MFMKMDQLVMRIHHSMEMEGVIKEEVILLEGMGMDKTIKIQVCMMFQNREI